MSDWRVPLTEVALTDADVEAVLDTLRSGWLTMGPRTIDLEAAFEGYIGAENAVAVASGGAALHLACAALGIGPGDEVIVPALSFTADVNSPIACGAHPVLADSEAPNRPAIDPADVERRITERTRAVIAAHMFGYAANIEALRTLCDERGVALIEDCAQAAGATLPNGEKAGTAGDVGCFSFFAKTQLGAGEGGMTISKDPAVAARIRSLRSHAMTSVTWDRHRGHAETYDVPDLGFNYRIDEPRARLVLSRLPRLDAAVGELRRVVLAYRERLAGVAGIEVLFADDEVERSGHFAFPVLVADLELRDRIRTSLHGRGVQTTFYPSLTRLTDYARRSAPGECPAAEEFADRHIALPLFPALTDERIDVVAAELLAALSE